MDSRHWPYSGPPASSAEWMAARVSQHEAFLDSLDRKEEPIPPDETPELRIDPPEEQDPVTEYDRREWLTKANWKRDKERRRLLSMTWDEIREFEAGIMQEVNAKAFAKRFACWVDKGCPLDKEKT